MFCIHSLRQELRSAWPTRLLLYQVIKWRTPVRFRSVTTLFHRSTSVSTVPQRTRRQRALHRNASCQRTPRNHKSSVLPMVFEQRVLVCRRFSVSISSDVEAKAKCKCYKYILQIVGSDCRAFSFDRCVATRSLIHTPSGHLLGVRYRPIKLK